MRFFNFLSLLGPIAFWQASGLAPTDEYRDADIQQSGYLPNHNMDPSVVNSATFGLLWKVSFNVNENFYAKPLTYTPLAGGPQILFLASAMNYIRTLDAKTGALINSRQVHAPFLASDLGCGDIANYVGIIGTPTIDPVTDTVYFFSKTYIPNFRAPGNTGIVNGVYYFHAVNINTLADIYPPVLIDGSVADNAPQKYFVGGSILQRPSLAQIGSVVYGAFGGHCDLFNYTGVIIGIDVVKANIVTQFAMESGPLAPQTNNLLQSGGGGEGGIWMSGAGLTSDGRRLFAVVGNGLGHQNLGAPASGSSNLQTLGEAAINLAVDITTGSLSLADYFQPSDYINLDAGDQDLGSSGLTLLDPGTFSGGGISKIGVTAGKNGKIYVLNANNLGGYKLGPAQTDGIIQTIVAGSAVFGAAGSYPGEGGYIYFTPVGKTTQAYSLGFGSNGIPQFSLAGQSVEISAGRVGASAPTITSLNGKPGTAIVWMSDPDAGLRAWSAVPQNGVLPSIKIPQVGGANKFQRPVFGDGRVYTIDFNGNLYCLGSPVKLPLNCTSPIDFGQVALGTKATQTITCIVNIAISSIVRLQLGTGYFSASNSSLPKGPLTAGAKFTFPVTWDLTNVQVTNTPNSSFGAVTPGSKSAPLTVLTVNGVSGYATSFPIGLTGTEVSTTPFLSVTPRTVDFGAVVILDPNNIPATPGTITITNQGLTNLTILGYAYTTNELDSSPIFTNSTIINSSWDLGYGFTAQTLPAIGSQIAPNTAIIIPVFFNPLNGTGSYSSFWQVWSDGGAVNIILEASASPPPIASLSISDGAGGWLPSSNLLMDFGKVAPLSSPSRQIRICNQGGSSLEIDKSKPPYGVFHIDDPAELHESQIILPGQCAYGTVLFLTNTEEYNLPDLPLNNTWTLNTNDLTWGVHVVQITATIVSKKVGPTTKNGTTVYAYLGCFAENLSGPRLFPNAPLAPTPTMTNGFCQSTCASNGNYAFAGTEFATECWCGNTPPPLGNQDHTDTYCNTACGGDPNDDCGATGYVSVFYDPTKYTAGADPSQYGPQTVKNAGNFVFQGCYSDGNGGRSLMGVSPSPPTGGFTIELCGAACKGYLYFGMEFANECYCGNSIGSTSVNQTSSVPYISGCSMLCAGNSMEYCGGPDRLNLYMQSSTGSSSSTGTSTSIAQPTTSSTSSTSSTSVPSRPTAVTTISGGTYLGCYSEGTTMRALSGLANPVPAGNNSVEVCAAACSKASFSYFGVEYSQECYCGNTINAGSVNQSSSDPNVNGCSMPCSGNASEYCGGPYRLNMYQLNSSTTKTTSTAPTSASTPAPTSPVTVTQLRGYSYLGCYSEGSAGRALSGLLNPISGSTTTIEACAAACSKYTYFGVEYAAECYCGNVMNAGSTNQTSSNPAVNNCNMACAGNPSEYCGGPNRLNLYKSLSTTLPSNTSTSKPSVTQSPFTSSSTSGSPATTTVSSSAVWTGTLKVNATIGSWEYLGCVTEGTTSRVLAGASYISATSMTIESCQSYCTAKNYGLAGLEYSSECYCANFLGQGATFTTSGCNMPCSGASSETCGGSNRLSVFSNTTFAYPTSPPTVGSYVLTGCYKDNATSRLLAGAAYVNTTSMTVESCVAYCAGYGTNGAVAGMEYAQECYCTAKLPATAVVAAPGSCSMPCPGNSMEFCGGVSVLNVYTHV